LTRRSRLPAEIAILAAVVVALGFVPYAAQKFLLPQRAGTTDITRSMDEAIGGPLILRQVDLSQSTLCDAAVDRAFAIIMVRLRPALDQLASGSPDIRIAVTDAPEINAFPLPAGIVYVETGLMRNLDSAEQIACVLGQELSHAAHRDPLALLARQVGVAAPARGGDLVSTLTQTLVNFQDAREVEGRADAFFVQRLAWAEIDPASFAHALESINKSEPKDPRLSVPVRGMG
jgi:Zn-dependent protease with chaperone function